MNRFKMVVAYDGVDFQGWQVQPHKKTVANCLQDTFEKTFDKKIVLLGASRTDTEVHALGQVATFSCDIDLDVHKMQRAWNNSLPFSIHIRSLEQVDASFHPHKNVVSKTYYYTLFLKRPLPFVARYGWQYPFMAQVDKETFEKALQVYVGKHDFRSFCKLEEEKSTVRTIHSISLHRLSRFGAWQVVIKGDGFLRFQIRRMIGCALDVARRDDLSVDFIEDILSNPDPQQQLTKADGRGLCLKEIQYSS